MGGCINGSMCRGIEDSSEGRIAENEVHFPSEKELRGL